MSLKPANRSRKALAPRTASPVTMPTYSLTGLPSMAVVVLTIIGILLQFCGAEVGYSCPSLPQKPSFHSPKNLKVAHIFDESGPKRSARSKDQGLERLIIAPGGWAILRPCAPNARPRP